MTFRVWFGDQENATRQNLVREIEAMNLSLEWSSANLLALSVQEGESQKLADYLQLRENEGVLQYETGRS